MNTKFLQDKGILVTDVGTIGAEIIEQLVSGDYGAVRKIIGVDNSESQIFELSNPFLMSSNVEFFLADISRENALDDYLDGIDIVFHCAALSMLKFARGLLNRPAALTLKGLRLFLSPLNALLFKSLCSLALTKRLIQQT